MKTITKLLFVAAFSLAAMTASAQWWNAGDVDYLGGNGQPLVTMSTPFLHMRATTTGNRGLVLRKNTTTATGWFWQDGSDIIRISNSAGGGTPHIAIPTSGNIGFNTAAPADQLHILGTSTADIRLESPNSKYLRFYEGATQKGYIGHSGTSMIMQNDETNGEIEIDGQTGITLRVNNNTAVDVDANGLVTIDKTSEAIRLSGSSSYLSFFNGATYNGYLWHNNTNMYLNNNNAAGNLYLGTGAGGVDMTINPSGNVGIGTTTPSSNLEISDTAPAITLTGTGRRAIDFNNGTSDVAWMSMIGTQLYVNNTAGGPVYIGGSDDVHLMPTGNVGIGVTNPSSKLEMVGNADIGNNIYLGKNAGAGDAFMRVGHNRGANGNAFFTLVGDASSYPGYGLRFLRMPTGESRIEHRGTQPMVFNAPDAGGYYSFKIGGASKVEFLGNTCRPGIDGGINLGQNGRRWAAVYAVNGTIQTSDRRLKKNIDKLDYGLAEIMRLKPVRYDWKDDNALLGNKIGLIAQEVQEVISEVVYDEQLELVDNEDGTQEYKTVKSENIGMNYSELIPVLINGIQEQQQQISNKDERIEALETKNTELQEGYDALNDRLNKLEAMLSNSNNTVLGKLNTEKNVVINGDGMVAELAQNQPNPFTENTTIKYFLPDGSTGAHMNIFSAEGKVLKTVKIDEVGQGQINLKANSLPAGTYMYQLITDAGIVGSKSMVLIN